jgi:putative transposase
MEPMPRANRCFLPNHVWHITHRCHKKDFLLKFVRDRRRWLYWLFEARGRFGLSILDYTVTSNHIHLLVQDQGRGEIARGMQLVAGRTAQEYNQRKNRKGAFWEDRYHATAVDKDEYLARCITYIDMNMVRAGVVSHPSAWPDSGYQEIQHPPKRYRIIDTPALMAVLGIDHLAELQRLHNDWVEAALAAESSTREPYWSTSLAVGKPEYVEDIKRQLGISARYHQIRRNGKYSFLREFSGSYKAHFEP